MTLAGVPSATVIGRLAETVVATDGEGESDETLDADGEGERDAAAVADAEGAATGEPLIRVYRRKAAARKPTTTRTTNRSALRPERSPRRSTRRGSLSGPCPCVDTRFPLLRAHGRR
jgi:hypothetical protein